MGRGDIPEGSDRRQGIPHLRRELQIVGLEAGQPCQLLGAQDFEDVIAQMDKAALAEILKNAIHIGRREPGAVGDVLLRQREAGCEAQRRARAAEGAV